MLSKKPKPHNTSSKKEDKLNLKIKPNFKIQVKYFLFLT